jgi:two-component system cell cycle sensor histidine kinase/response regulator CckA
MQLEEVFMSYIKNEQYNELEDEAIHKAFFENNPLPMWIHDVDSLRFISVNRAALKKYGYSREEFLEKTINDIHPPLETDKITIGLRPALGGRRIHRHRLKSGELIEVEATSHELDFYGRRAVFTIVHDRAGQNPVRTYVNENEVSSRDFIEAMPMGYYRSTQNGFFLECNSSFAKMLGYTREELLALGVPEELSCNPGETDANEASRSYSARPDTYLLKRKDGAEIWVEDFPIYVRDEEGEVIYREGICRFMGEREAGERRQIEDRMRLQSAALDAVANAVVITDKDGKVEYVNPSFEKLTGYSSSYAVGADIGKLVKSGKQDQYFYNEMWNTIMAGKVWHGELVNCRKDGTLYNEEMTITPVLNDEGAVTNFIAVKEDITRRMSLEDELTQAQKLDVIGRLAGGVAHDYNNVLGVILGYGELIKSKLGEQEVLRRQLDAIIAAAKRGSDLTKRLLSFARREVVSPKIVSANLSIEAIKEMLLQIVGENRDLVLNLAEDLWSIKVDSTQLDQVLVNLATNARDAIEDVGKITIETSNVFADDIFIAGHPEFTKGEYVKISFADTGKGIDKETLKKIFEPFFTTKSDGKGTGLGLAMVHAIIKQNRGSIEVQSEVGVGTKFEIYFPRSYGKPEELPEQMLSEIPKGNATILIVEDRPDLLESSKKGLEQYGYKVLTAVNPQEALSLCTDFLGDIDLLLADVVMPNMNGGELSSRIRKIKPGIRTLFMSGYTADVVAQHDTIGKRIAFIQKPFTPQALAKKLQEVLVKS